MELCGAVTFAKLMHNVKSALKFQIEGIHCWTDSTITLSWIQGNASKWKPFVSNRVLEIQSLIPAQHWHHIKGENNPADIISRGSTVVNLLNNNLWWNGPTNLQIEFVETELKNDLTDSDDVKTEVRQEERKSIKVHSISEVHTNIVLQLLENHSSLSKLKRILAYCLRFVHNCRSKISERNLSSLTTKELQGALHTLIKLVQRTHFENDIKTLEKSNELKLTSKLLSLSPFVYKSGILRVGGRLAKTDWSFVRKHPILLPNKDKLTKLIFEEEHIRNLYAGPQALLSAVRIRFWPLCGRSIARQVVHNCIRCFRNNPTSMNQLMGQLPKKRVQPFRPFFCTGVDFGGPFITLVDKGRGRKT